MSYLPKEETLILVCWTYSKAEWSDFLRSTRKKWNIFHQLADFISRRSLRTAPVVKISPETVHIGNDQQQFSSAVHALRFVELREQGAVNILSLTYESTGNRREIKIPIPKGKLREAIEVQEKLIQGNDGIRVFPGLNL